MPLRVQWISQTRGCRFPSANPWLAHVTGDPLYCSGDGERHPIQARGSWLVVQAPCRACRRRRYSGKAARHIKGFALLQNMEARSRQLVGQRLDCYHSVCPGFLALVETLGFGAEAQRKVRRFDKSPRQILVAVPGVAFAFFLAVARVLAIDATRIRGKVADGGKAVDGARFEQDDGGENAANFNPAATAAAGGQLDDLQTQLLPARRHNVPKPYVQAAPLLVQAAHLLACTGNLGNYRCSGGEAFNRWQRFQFRLP